MEAGSDRDAGSRDATVEDASSVADAASGGMTGMGSGSDAASSSSSSSSSGSTGGGNQSSGCACGVGARSGNAATFGGLALVPLLAAVRRKRRAARR
jgi:hypothetical protein